MPVRRIRPGRRMSEAVIHNDRVFTSGLTADPPAGSAEEQTRNILQQIDRLLEEAGTDKTRLLIANIWLSDMRYFDDMNKAWDAWISKDNCPTRTTLEAKLASPDYLVEIAIIAAK